MPKPFDLEKFKAGARCVDNNGKEVKFIAHVPDAKESFRVLYLEPCGEVGCCNELGVLWQSAVLFLADPPKVKRELWVAWGVDEKGNILLASSEIDKRFATDQFNRDGDKLIGCECKTWEEEAP